MNDPAKKILIIDDDHAMSTSIKNFLMIYGKYMIQNFQSVLGLKMLLKFTPDLIILDVKMPDKGGYEIGMNIKNNAGLKHIKIIEVSRVSGGIEAACMETFGADYYFEKPLDTHRFNKFVNKLIGH
ncbi:MAG: response regulator [Candidatus Omnitrophica bacterium]|nr:response regulator [Candidatus Omnitrophota bacterium]